jgi:glyoxylate utilization-related uncharacterized protein
MNSGRSERSGSAVASSRANRVKAEPVVCLNDELLEGQRDDFVYMAPYCPQGFTATGREPAEYLLCKDVWRDGF